MTDVTIDITPAQADILRSRAQEVERTRDLLRAVERERDLVLATLCAGHGIDNQTGFTLTGNALTVTVPTEVPEVDGA